MGEYKWRIGVVDYNLVPFSHKHQGSLSLTSGKIRKKSLIGREKHAHHLQISLLIKNL